MDVVVWMLWCGCCGVDVVVWMLWCGCCGEGFFLFAGFHTGFFEKGGGGGRKPSDAPPPPFQETVPITNVLTARIQKV